MSEGASALTSATLHGPMLSFAGRVRMAVVLNRASHFGRGSGVINGNIEVSGFRGSTTLLACGDCAQAATGFLRMRVAAAGTCSTSRATKPFALKVATYLLGVSEETYGVCSAQSV